MLHEQKAPAFRHLETYAFVSAVMKALPILFVPLLVPLGTPVGTAKEMGAGPVITGRDTDAASSDDDGDGGLDLNPRSNQRSDEGDGVALTRYSHRAKTEPTPSSAPGTVPRAAEII